MKRLFIISAFPVLLNGCGLAVDRDVRAYHTCLYRHPQDAVVCDGPRQAYEVDPFIVQARSPVRGPAAGSSLPPAPVWLHPSPKPTAPIQTGKLTD